MTATDRSASPPEAPPGTNDAPLPRTGLLHTFRPAAAWLVRQLWNPEVYGTDRVPAEGPVVLAANHIGWLDGPLLAILPPRPVHVLTKKEMFESPAMRQFLLAAGQIPLQRGTLDAAAIRIALRSLEAGHCVGVFPEGRRGAGEGLRVLPGAAYLALVTGAPVVPLAFLGTRLPGGSSDSVPAWGSRVTATFGEPVRFPTRPWPRRQGVVREASEEVGRALRATIAEARELTGLALPGPIPREEPR